MLNTRHTRPQLGAKKINVPRFAHNMYVCVCVCVCGGGGGGGVGGDIMPRNLRTCKAGNSGGKLVAPRSKFVGNSAYSRPPSVQVQR